MCGVFGYIGTDLDKTQIYEIMSLAGTRGPHAHGMAYLCESEQKICETRDKLHKHRTIASENIKNDAYAGIGIHTHIFASRCMQAKVSIRKGLGRIKPEILMKDIMPAALIGHCRLSTSGDYHDMRNNQPIVSDMGFAVSHNGNIPRSSELARKTGVSLKTDCDSEILLRIAEKYGIEDTIMMFSHYPMTVLFLQQDKIFAYRNQMPLFIRRDSRGIYLCSRRFRRAEAVPNGELLRLEGGNRNGNCNHEAV